MGGGWTVGRVLERLRPDIRALRGYTPGEQVNNCVKLNTNECAWPPPPGVMEALRDLGGDAVRLYPQPQHDRLRDAAASFFGVRPGQVMAGNGSDDCLTVLHRAFLAPGDGVAVPWPTYGLYDTLAALQGACITHHPFLDTDRTWDLPDTLDGCGARMVLVANPNNPSGTLVPPHRLRRLADTLDGILVVDEAYVDFADEGSSMLPWLDEHPNLVVLRSFSKSWAMAGLRLGLLFAHEELTAHLMKVKDSYNVNAATQAAGIAALADRPWHASMRLRTLEARTRLLALVAAHGWSWPPTQANFVLATVGPQAGSICQELRRRGILVRWWDTPELRERLRITVGTPAQIDALEAALEDIGV